MQLHRISHIINELIQSIHRILRILVVSIIFILSTITVSGQQVEGVSPAGTDYLLYTPLSYDPMQDESPLLVTLMGGGEIGDDLTVFFEGNKNPAFLINRGEWPADYPFVVLTPQLPRDLSVENPNDQTWPTSLIDEVVTHIINSYNINENKIYFTGVSLGARGCWDYAADYPQKVAAMVPMSGAADSTTACSLKDIPIWALHGGNDGLVDPFSNSTVGMVNAINNCNGLYHARLDIIPSRGHDIWNDIYPETMGLSIFDWLLKFEKGQSSNTAPYVGVGPNLKLVIPENFINLYGFAFDVDGTISNYNWELISSLSADIEVIDNNNIKLYPHEAGLHKVKLTATDDDATSQADTIEIECFNQIPSELNFMTGLILQDGVNDVDLFPLTAGDNIINLFSLNTNDINIRAVEDGVCNSFRFAVNGYQNIRTENRSDAFLLSRRRNPPEWNVSTGSYTISASPFSNNRGRGTQGISFIRRLLVFDQEPKTYDLIPDSEISNTANWQDSNTTDNPDTFQENFQTFNINDSAYLNSPILEIGVVSNIHLTTGSYLTLNDSLAIPLILDSAATLQINHPTFVDFISIHPKSNIIYNSSGTIDIIEAGNLTITAGNQLNFKNEEVIVSNLSLESAAAIQSTGGNLKINIQNNLLIEGSADFTPTHPFSIMFNSDTLHHIYYAGDNLSLNTIELLGDDTLEIVHKPALQLHVSKINIASNALLTMEHCNLIISGDDVFSTNSQSGKLKIGNQSTLSIDAAPSQNNYLRFAETGNTLKNLQFNISGGQKIVLTDTLNTYGEIAAENGVITSNGYLNMLATDSMTAYILNVSGSVEGDVKSGKLIPQGRVYRYIGSSTQNYSIEKLQEFIPITGSFSGATTGANLADEPSIFTYDSNSETWLPFPVNSNQELFEIGKGYAVFFRNESEMAQIEWLGALIQDDFSYSLSGNTDVQSELTGWNLVANPFATPVKWSTTGWANAGISNTITVADNTVAGGRFLVWDGEVGDAEFSGILAQNQAFWVRSINENPSLTISESAKVALNNTATYRSANPPVSGMVISLTNAELVDRLYYKMNTNGSTAYLPEKDAVKKLNSYFSLYYEQDSTPPLAIKNLPEQQCFNHLLGIEGIESGSFSLEFDFMSESLKEGNFFLTDKLTDSLILIEDSFQYDFSVSSADTILPGERFKLAYEFSLPLAEVTLIGHQLEANYSQNIQWYKDSVILEGETNPILIPEESGNYHFQVNSNACLLISESVNYMITANKTTEEGFYSYPNPIRNNNFIIHAIHHEQDDFEIALLNSNGQEVLKIENANFKEDIIEVRLPEKLINGLYYLSIRSKNKSSYHKVIIAR